LNIKSLYLVDPYVPFTSFVKGRKEPLAKHEEYMGEMLKRITPHGDKVLFLRKPSLDAANEIPNELDFVYIDGNHSYDSVMEDITTYYPKVRNGGIIGGHDYLSVYQPNLTKAVDDFAKEYGYEVKYGCIDIYDWWVVKK
jgi:hypothetical protein